MTPSRHVIALDRPAERIADSFLLGDGRLGVTVAGGAPVERFDLNVDTLWSGGPLRSDEGPSPAPLLPELREAIRSHDWIRASDLARRLQVDGWTQSFQPAGMVSWEWTAGSRDDGYERTLDLAASVATTRAGGDLLETFVDPIASVMVAVGGGPRRAEATFDTPHPGAQRHVDVVDGVTITTVTARVPANVIPNYVEDDDPVRYASDEPDDDGRVDEGMGFAVAWAVQEADGGARLLATAVSGYRGWRERPVAAPDTLRAEAVARISSVLKDDTAALRERTELSHRRLFDRADLDLSSNDDPTGEAARAELFFDLGRHLLISSSRPGTEAANLQGIWNVDVRPGWSSNYTTNINTTMNYWGAERTGLGDLQAPLFDLTTDLAECGQETARRHYGAAGSVVHHNTDLWRFTAPVTGDPQWSNWPSALPWLAAHAWEHALGDPGDAFAAEVALPIHRAAAAFALDLLEENEDGALEFSPSTSPEHSFVLADGARAAVSAGSAMDQELVHEVLGHFVALSARCGIDGELVDRARRALPRVRGPRIAEGMLQEWGAGQTPSELGHRHLSHLYGLFPGDRITARRTPEEFAAARRALESRLAHGSGYTGWSQAWVLCLSARLRQRDRAAESLRVLTHELSSASLLDLHPHDDWPGGAIFQIDGNLGAVGGIAELLLQSHDDVIDILPTLPTQWRQGSVRGLRARDGHVVSIRWRDGAAVSFTIEPAHSGPVCVEVGGASVQILDESGRVVSSTVRSVAPGMIRIEAELGRGRLYTGVLGR